MEVLIKIQETAFVFTLLSVLVIGYSSDREKTGKEVSSFSIVIQSLSFIVSSGIMAVTTLVRIWWA